MVTMWLKALRVIPRLNKAEWDALDLISKWLVASRGAVFVMTAIAAAIGGLMAYRFGDFSGIAFVLTILGLVFAHATNNMLNDYVDYKKGVDHDNYFRAQYGPHPLEHGFLSKKKFLNYILVTGLIATVIGLILSAMVGPKVLWLLCIGMFFLLFYTWPLKYFGLGELSVVLVWGPLMVGGSYFVVSGGNINLTVLLVSLVYSIGPTTVLLGKHTDKLKEDKLKKVHTLPVVIGEKASRYTVIILWILQYAFIIWLVLEGMLGPAILLVFLSVPKAISVIKIYLKPRPIMAPKGSEQSWPLYLVAHAFEFNRQFGMLFLLGLIIEILLFKIL